MQKEREKERVMMKKRSSIMLVTIGMLGMLLLSGCPAGSGGDAPAPIPPPTPTALSAEGSLGPPMKVTLTWTASAGAASYRIYRDGTLISPTFAGSQATDTAGLVAQTNYCYTITAVDGLGTESVRSDAVCTSIAMPPGTTIAASIQLLVSNPQLDSDIAGAPTVTLTANVLDSNLNLLSGKDVSFKADSGVLLVTRGKTDASGTAQATLGAGGDPANRVINVTAYTAGVSPATNTVNVNGTNLSISGAASLSSGDSTPLTIFLKDSKGKGISGRTITVTSAKGNTLSAATWVTNASGQVICNVTATMGGADKITASAIGATKDFDLMVNTTILRFITPSPTAVTEIPIGTSQAVTAEYVNGTTPQAGVVVNFVTTRGALSASSATTGPDGRATVSVSSTNSGPALLVASVAAGPTSQAGVEFVAPSVFSLTLQASPATIGTNSGGLETEKSLITATVRDANNNLVKNKTVTFTILSDVSGGRLTPASAITDSFGSANAYFIAGASSGGLAGVTIQAKVVGTTVMATTTLTVAKKALFIALATGQDIVKVDPNKYQKDYVALVTDSAGNPVVGATVVATVTPMYYWKGYWVRYYRPGTIVFLGWSQVPTLDAASSTLPTIPACMNEDGITYNPLYDYNGVLDPGEDQNGNNRLDPGNIASVTAATTDSTGHATVSVVYARDYAYWAAVRLEAFANDLKGSTASAETTFTLTGAGIDYNDEKVSPPGNPSPFGTSATCYVDLTVMPLSSSEMAISWERSPTADHYHVYRNGILIANTTLTSYTDSGLSHGTLYCYQVTEVDAAGIESSFTGTVCNASAVLPPSGVTATAISPSQIRLSWNALAGATGYRIYRDGVHLKDVVSTSTLDSGLAASTLYCYAVSGNNAAGVESPKSVQMCATTQLSAPPTPTGLAAAGREVPPSVTLTWNTSPGANKYNIYRDGLYALSVNAPAVTVVDTGLVAKTNYCYTISAEDVSGNESAQSTQVCTATGGAVIPQPTGLTATLLPGPQVRLNWNGTAGATGYRIYRDGTAKMVSGTTTATDGTVNPSTGYCYAVSAMDGMGSESPRSAQVCIATGVAPPPTPSGLLVEEAMNPRRIVLTWGSSAGAVSYRIYRNGGTIPLLSPIGVPATDTTVAASTLYCYTISAVSSTGSESAQSDAVCKTTSAAGPPTPATLTATSIAGPPPRIALTWTTSAGATSYRIYRDGTFLVSVTGAQTVDTAVVAGVQYCYTISAVDGAGLESPKTSPPTCATAGGTAAPPTPTGLVAVQAPPPAVNTVNLSWNLSAGAVSYRIYRNGSLLLSPAAPPAIDITVTANTFYCYTISAVDGANNESAQSTTPQCLTIMP
jgi:fibronectin type 3 domain-containing protein